MYQYNFFLQSSQGKIGDFTQFLQYHRKKKNLKIDFILR